MTSIATEPQEADQTMVRSVKQGRLLVLLAIVLFALTLRTAVTSLTPLLTQISEDLHFGATIIGVFGMLPTAMFAAAGIVTPFLTSRIGLERTTLVAVAATAIGIGVRSLMGGTLGLLAFSCLALIGMGVGNVVLPPLVKRYFSDNVAVLSTAYLTCVQLGTMVPALAAVPVADAYGWRVSLAIWAIIPIAAFLPWLGIVLARRGHDVEDVTGEAPSEPTGRIWRSPLAWGAAAMFGMTSLNTYAMFTWIPTILSDSGGSAALGGNMVALFSGVGFVATLIVPSLCTRMVNPFPLVIVFLGCFVVGFLGLLFAPMTLTWVWVIALGLGPTTFPMALTLVNLRTRTGAGSASLSGFMQGVGYLAACAGPLGFGLLHEATHGWTAPFMMLFGCLVILGLGAYQACKPRMLEDTWH
ncbi:MFS transporter [Tsukamurella tyrosinosolvens]|uniref:CynX/NimT family MFS transporter n=1 Tax=Tsukamurella tyrosinosolvens TaxID=57704 RepID=UPI000792954E|nr:MFS transporter [Tsukamurella tyrosinosolvens]AUN40656.1 MFS transporter [Tsukamurella tyrosinosolvens]KXP06102.1 MFS transporter [Tsukamurella tyrosinosolvens]KZL95933.1 MFS transporter [Tsukamurella tyrosinosolvens]MCA4993249.1 MFS transporter [Tsukamurella tyrosinosolvens]MEC4613258.1 MFS transporter [Tsukamurella tyrosinosolvens]